MRALRKPFFVVNPKAYLFGNDILKLAQKADELATKYDVDILFTAQHVDLRLISEHSEKLFVVSQHLDGFNVGPGMGKILPDALVAAGVEGSFLNHAEHPLNLGELVEAVQFAKVKGLLSIVCANSITEVKAIASLQPSIMVCEPNELIGTGKTSDDDYMKKTQTIIRTISPQTLVLQAAGISSAKDVKNALDMGADGTGGTSGIVCAVNPEEMLTEMIEELVKFK